MTLILECDKGFNAKPGYFTSRVLYRVWWLWFAVSLLRVTLPEFASTSYDWKAK